MILGIPFFAMAFVGLVSVVRAEQAAMAFQAPLNPCQGSLLSYWPSFYQWALVEKNALSESDLGRILVALETQDSTVLGAGTTTSEALVWRRVRESLNVEGDEREALIRHLQQLQRDLSAESSVRSEVADLARLVIEPVEFFQVKVSIKPIRLHCAPKKSVYTTDGRIEMAATVVTEAVWAAFMKPQQGGARSDFPQTNLVRSEVEEFVRRLNQPDGPQRHLLWRFFVGHQSDHIYALPEFGDLEYVVRDFGTGTALEVNMLGRKNPVEFLGQAVDMRAHAYDLTPDSEVVSLQDRPVVYADGQIEVVDLFGGVALWTRTPDVTSSMRPLKSDPPDWVERRPRAIFSLDNAVPRNAAMLTYSSGFDDRRMPFIGIRLIRYPRGAR